MATSDTSSVPPPKSSTSRLRWPALVLFSSPCAMAAAVDPLIKRTTFRPATAAASLTACRWEQLKETGTVTTAFLTVRPKGSTRFRTSASRMARSSTGRHVLVSPMNCTTTWDSSFGPPTTLNGQRFKYCCTCGSENLRPNRRVIPKTVLCTFVVA
ncbi:hypothetical protein PF001_g5446 [Phytophthora fragariae]|uniref:Uncharacterized protein n=1 Tax=Phytophthora fragariae TaxID=53985 RepID=A0A6A4EDV8_9STRA|nr:hypothetical protein PF001_g5446 [Phytophthora fragariae]